MLQRVVPDLLGMKNILALNDEAHHCYRGKPPDEDEDEEGPLKGDDRKEAEKNREAARAWISGLEIVQHKLGIARVLALSATPFFLRGSGYAEGTLFPWTVSDFSLFDAIESGIAKLPRVPVADNIPGGDMPKFRNLWDHIGKKRIPPSSSPPIWSARPLPGTRASSARGWTSAWSTWRRSAPPPCCSISPSGSSTSGGSPAKRRSCISSASSSALRASG